MPTKEDVELYEKTEGVSKTKKPKPSEKITLLDGIKWLEKYCKSLIPIMIMLILSLVSFQMVMNAVDGRQIISLQVWSDGSLYVDGVDVDLSGGIVLKNEEKGFRKIPFVIKQK